MLSILITEPAEEPVTLTEAKAQLRLTTSDENTLISTLITVARQMAEQSAKCSLITQTWEAHYPEWKECFVLPNGPVSSITSVKYWADSSGTTTMSSNSYVFTSAGSLLEPAYGTTWPAHIQKQYPIIVRYVAGYGAAAAVKSCAKQYILAMVSAMYHNRESLSPETLSAVPYIDRLLDPVRQYGA